MLPSRQRRSVAKIHTRSKRTDKARALAGTEGHLSGGEGRGRMVPGVTEESHSASRGGRGGGRQRSGGGCDVASSQCSLTPYLK